MAAVITELLNPQDLIRDIDFLPAVNYEYKKKKNEEVIFHSLLIANVYSISRDLKLHYSC